MNWNDRRKAKKAASATTRAQITAMAKSGTLRATTEPTTGSKNFNRVERSAVKSEAMSNSGGKMPNKDNYARAAKTVSQQADVRGFDGPAYRAMQTPGYKKGKK
jgi:hypothetical protein